MIRLAIWLRLPNGDRRQAGELAVADPDSRHGGALRGEFRYSPAYLNDPQAFPLDPVHLPLRTGIFEADRPKAGVHAVFEDSLPDDWGRGLLVRRYRIPRHEQRVPIFLKWLGMQGLGALGYTEPPPSQGQRRRPRSNRTRDPKEVDAPASAGLPDLPALVAAADRYTRGLPDALGTDLQNDPGLRLLFRAGSSPGGARPKALILDQGIHWLAKFPNHKDEVDMVRVEAACLELARRAGVEVPDFRVVDMGHSAALLVRRFDVPEDGAETGGRHHMISLSTLLGAENYYQLGYEDIAEVLRKVSGRPETDLPALFRLSVFNAVLGNTDDHLKNFALLHSGPNRGGWRLAPAYDLLPDVADRIEHVLHFGLRGNYPDRKALTELSKRVGVSSETGARILDQVTQAVGDWMSVFQAHRVPTADIERLGPSINRRLLHQQAK